MSIKAGQLITTGDDVLVQRLQQSGPGLNIPTERIAELGNYEAVAVTRGVPDLTFTMECYDVTTAPESMITKDATSPFNMASPLPIDVVSQWKAGKDAASPFLVVESVAIPFLVLESASYRFGTQANAAQTFTFRGDSIFYNPGASVVENFVASGTAGQDLLLANLAGVYNGDAVAGPRYTQGVKVGNKRLLYGVDYTETVTGAGAFRTVHVIITAAYTAATDIQIVYFTDAATSYLQNVHADPSVKPAAIRGKDITVLINGVAATDRWSGIQSVQVDQRFTVERDEELGSSQATDIGYSDVPNLSGNMVIRFRDPADFHTRLQEALGAAAATEALGPDMFTENRIDVVLHHPDTGAVLKTLEITDAIINIPGYTGRVNTKLDMTLEFQSNSGNLSVLNTAPV